MPDTSTFFWIVSHFGIAIVALYLLDRSHRAAIEKMTVAYDRERQLQEVVIELLQVTIGTLHHIQDLHERRGHTHEPEPAGQD